MDMSLLPKNTSILSFFASLMRYNKHGKKVYTLPVKPYSGKRQWQNLAYTFIYH